MTYITTNDVENVSDYALLANAVYKDSVVKGKAFTAQSLTADDGSKDSYFSAELATELEGKYAYLDSMNDRKQWGQVLRFALLIKKTRNKTSAY